MQQRGRVTIPTDVDVVPETLTLMERWGADAIRDCDGTDYPEELRAVDAKVYSAYYDPQAGGVPQLHGQFSGIHYVGPGAYV